MMQVVVFDASIPVQLAFYALVEHGKNATRPIYETSADDSPRRLSCLGLLRFGLDGVVPSPIGSVTSHASWIGVRADL